MHDRNPRCSRSLRGIALAALLALASACGHSSTDRGPVSFAGTTDETGDVADTYDHSPVDAPDYVDVSHLLVAAEGAHLVFILDVAGDLPAAMNPSQTLVIELLIDLDGGEAPDYIVKVRSQDRWRPTLSSIVPPQLGAIEDFPSSAVIDGRRVTVRINRAAIGDPDFFRLRGAVAFEDHPEPDPLIGLSAIDGVPDVADEALEVRVP